MTFALWNTPVVRVDCWSDAIGAGGFAPIAKGGLAGIIGDAGETQEAVSSSIQDDAAQQGAKTIRVVYLDGAGVLQTQVITMSGMVAAAGAAADVSAVLGAFVETTGTNNANSGDITLRKASAGASSAVILAGRNTWSPGAFVVPAGKRAVFRGGEFFVGDINSNVEIQIEADVNPHTGVRSPGLFQVLASSDTRRQSKTLGFPPRADFFLPARTMLRARARALGGTTKLTGAFLVEQLGA